MNIDIKVSKILQAAIQQKIKTLSNWEDKYTRVNGQIIKAQDTINGSCKTKNKTNKTTHETLNTCYFFKAK